MSLQWRYEGWMTGRPDVSRRKVGKDLEHGRGVATRQQGIIFRGSELTGTSRQQEWGGKRAREACRTIFLFFCAEHLHANYHSSSSSSRVFWPCTIWSQSLRGTNLINRRRSNRLVVAKRLDSPPGAAILSWLTYCEGGSGSSFHPPRTGSCIVH